MRDNHLYIRCAKCHADITLSAQYIFDSVVLCGECNETEGEEIYADELDSNS